MSLTPKQQAFVDELKIRQVYALRLICRHIGMLPLTPDVEKQNRAMMPEKLLVWALWALVAPVPKWHRLTAMLILDLVSCDWRDVAGVEIMGALVERTDPLVRKWRATVLANDNGTCRRCGSMDSLHAHHIVRWSDDPSLRIDASNGMALCEECHIKEHRTYG